MYLSLDGLERDVYSRIERSDLNSALALLVDFVSEVIANPIAAASVFGSKRLDHLCVAVGREIARNIDLNDVGYSEAPVSVIVASSLETSGGHTLVVEDMIRAQPNVKHIVILTDIFERVNGEFLTARFGDLAVLKVAPKGDYVEKAKWLIKELAAVQADSIFIFTHHQDAVAISALQPSLGKKSIYFYHHADHHLSLGVHLPETVHIDPHSMGFNNCRHNEKIINNYYLPLVVEDRGGAPLSKEFLIDGELRTCSAGSQYKFQQRYPYSYIKMIVCRLEMKSGIHIHIGDIPSEMEQELKRSLLESNVDLNRFVHIPWVESLWAALVDNKVDLYISSFPYGGGRAAIETMGAGIPLLMHSSDSSRFNGGVDMAYEGAFVWRRHLEEFYAVLDSLTPQLLEAHSMAGRKHYLSRHHASVLRHGIVNMIEGRQCEDSPPLRSYEPDSLQKFMNLNAAVEGYFDNYKLEIRNLKQHAKNLEEMRSDEYKKSQQFMEEIAGLQSVVIKKDLELRSCQNRLGDKDMELHQRNLELQFRDQQLEDQNNLLIAAANQRELMSGQLSNYSLQVSILEVSQKDSIAKEIELQNTINNIKNEKTSLQHEIELIHGSYSWRLTRPLRWLNSVIRRDR